MIRCSPCRRCCRWRAARPRHSKGSCRQAQLADWKISRQPANRSDWRADFRTPHCRRGSLSNGRQHAVGKSPSGKHIRISFDLARHRAAASARIEQKDSGADRNRFPRSALLLNCCVNDRRTPGPRVGTAEVKSRLKKSPVNGSLLIIQWHDSTCMTPARLASAQPIADDVLAQL